MAPKLGSVKAKDPTKLLSGIHKNVSELSFGYFKTKKMHAIQIYYRPELNAMVVTDCGHRFYIVSSGNVILLTL